MTLWDSFKWGVGSAGDYFLCLIVEAESIPRESMSLPGVDLVSWSGLPGSRKSAFRVQKITAIGLPRRPTERS